jgi:hypothetical protein
MKTGDFYEDVQYLMGLHSAEAGIMVAERNGYDTRDNAIKSIQDHITDIEGFSWHYSRKIKEAKSLLQRYKNTLQKK